MTDREQHFIVLQQLCIGLYVHLDVAWMHHPFALSSFKIKDEAQIHTIRNLGLQKIRYDPLRSDCSPLSLENSEAHIQPAPTEPVARVAFLSERVQHINLAIRECEKHFIRATGMARQALHKVGHDPRKAMVEASTLINDMVDQALLEGDAIIHVMDGRRLGEETFCHPLNVTVLSLMMAKALKLSVEESRCLGLAALFHDIGKADIPGSVLMNEGDLNKAELAVLQRHAECGASIIRNAEKNTRKKTGASEHIAALIAQHHEYADGSGYPEGLKGAEIDPLARILSLANVYDNLCSPVNAANAMTPYGALSHLFSSERKKHDSALLNVFIKMLGIYPPGSIVMLNDGTYGIVVSATPQQLMRPLVLLHDRWIDRDAPNILDLNDDESINISQCIHIGQLPKDAADYLQCRQKLSYYFRVESGVGEKTPA